MTNHPNRSKAARRLRDAAPAMLAALEAEEALTSGKPTPWPCARDCKWCGACVAQVHMLRRAAIKAAKGE